ncbi:three rows [Haematobia irritans]|uniref:three rows n=1 Tax=Haematobia irritans TaxID=7368 RepID=UPI003F50C7EA
MENKFEDELCSDDEVVVLSAKTKIAKYFKCYGDSGHQDAEKHQMIFASRIIHTIAGGELKHPEICTEIITSVFADLLRPDASIKYWTTYVNNLRYFHYSLVTKKQFELASQMYHYICSFPNSKLQTDYVCTTIVNIYCNHLLLQKSYLQTNRHKALAEFNHVIESLTCIFEEMLERNKTHNLQYEDVLRKIFAWLFPNAILARIKQLFSTLGSEKLMGMFMALFKLSNQQKMPLLPVDAINEHAQYIVETLNTFLLFDVVDGFQSKLCLLLLESCRHNIHLQSNEPISSIFAQLYAYIKLICVENPAPAFNTLITKCCKSFRLLFERYSKAVMSQQWFKDVLVFLSTIHNQIQNANVFSSFWQQMTNLSSYIALLALLVDSMKLAPCISSESKLNTLACCTSLRKHIILYFAQTALSIFVLYCQNVKDEPIEELGNDNPEEKDAKSIADTYIEKFQTPLILITSHAFKVLDKMDCVNNASQDVQVLITRFKQAAVSVCTKRQAITCMMLCEIFVKGNNKIPETEFPLLIRRVYKAMAQCKDADTHIIREIQMCYITSLLQLSSEIDFNQIRGQISLFYSDSSKEVEKSNPAENGEEDQKMSTSLPHDDCLLHILSNSTHILRPHLKGYRKKLLHWMEVQHATKYLKANINLMKSLVLSSQNYYDFIITMRSTKLPVSDVPKFMSIHKYLRNKCGLNRLENLTYGHIGTIMLQSLQNSRTQKVHLDSKEFSEEKLEHLLLHKEMEAMTICKELQYVKMAYDAFEAFEQFYTKFDEEPISSDDALIDWEAVIDDLAVIAQYLQFGSYIEYASQIWMLHYKISQMILDDFSSIRSLTFFCEYSSFFDQNENGFVLDRELQLQLPAITNGLELLETLSRRKQNIILLATLQVAYYYIRNSKQTYGQMLLQFVEEKHYELPDRQGCYDLIKAYLDIIKYKLLWKHYDCTIAGSNSVSDDLMLKNSLMEEIERTRDRLREFVFTPSEGLSYNMLVTSLAQDMAECSANRLYDNFLKVLLVAACKCCVQNGFALRMVQIMSLWMWINLQMECIESAQIKLNIIEYITGIKTLKELTANNPKTFEEINTMEKLYENANDLLIANHNSAGIEATRRMVPVELSPIKTGKLQLRPHSQKTELKSYFKYTIDIKTMPKNDLLKWTYFTVGCLNARLYFLVEDYVQLEPFYELGKAWIEMRQNKFNTKYFKNIELMAIQHYVNFLRATCAQEKAIECLNYGLNQCESMQLDVDAVYRINFKLQLVEAMRELEKHKGNETAIARLEKALKYNMSPEKLKCNQKNIKHSGKNGMSEFFTASIKKKVNVDNKRIVNISSRKPKLQVSSSSSSSSPETKTKLKDSHKFNICEDSIEIIESDDSDNECVKVKKINELKQTVKDLFQAKDHLTPITTKNAKSVRMKMSSQKQKPNQPDENKMIDSIDLLESPAVSPNKVASSISSVQKLLPKENIANNDNLELIATKMEKLELVDKRKRPKNTSRVRKSPLDVKTVAPVIILEDSPSIKPVETPAFKPRGRRRKNLQDPVVMKEPAQRPRRRRNLDNENIEFNNNCTPKQTLVLLSSNGSDSTPTVTNRRRQQI